MRRMCLLALMQAVILTLLLCSGCSPDDKGGTTQTPTDSNANVPSEKNLDSAVPDNTGPMPSDSTIACPYRDGTYTGRGSGRSPGIVVTVTITSGTISDISVVSYNDTYVYFDDAADALIPAILAAQSTQVDTFSGATLSSKGILEAVDDALSQAAMP